MTFTYETIGFPHDVAYTADLSKVIKEFENDFRNLNHLHVIIKELSYHMIEYASKDPVAFADEGQTCNVILSTWKSYDRSGTAVRTPSPFEVFTSLRAVLKNAVVLYRERFV